MKKTLISIAIISTLPLTAMADNPVANVGPAHYSGNSPVVATQSAPYQTVDITPATDGAHIASTAYVKGAYNDAIAAVNKVADAIPDVSDFVDSTELSDVLSDFSEQMTTNIMQNVESSYQPKLTTSNGADMSQTVMGSNTMHIDIMSGDIMDYSNLSSLDDQLVSVGGLVTALQDVTVKAYTTWGGNTTADVHLSSGNQSN